MLESEIQEQLKTKEKNIQFLNERIYEIEIMSEEEANKLAYDYYLYQDYLFKGNFLDDTLTQKRLLYEMNSNKAIIPDKPNYYRELIPIAIKTLKDEGYIYWIDGHYSCKETQSNKTILNFLVKNYFKYEKFGGYITRSDFKKWVCDVFSAMNYSFSEDSIKKQINQLL